uniref:Cathepsin propeptide inhibitor domain-containing protein n=1 Tax=Aegilops tauschii subsp. strangulata TaxID=200361 RepID=A0A453LUE1_AEGTS
VGTDEVILPSDKDLESEEALWALYKRWCKSFNEERDYDEMVRRFDTFKDSVRMVDSVNKANLPYTLKLSQFADGKLAERR